MKILGIVPARAGSKRVPRKNLRLLGGKPLVAWSLEAALGAKSLQSVLLSTDSDEALALAAAQYPKVVGLKRPEALSTDTALAIEFVRHALSELARCGQSGFDAVAIIQPSSPFTTSEDIDRTAAVLAAAPEADSAVSVMKLEHAVHPVKMKRLEGDKLLAFVEEEKGRMASHELSELYVRNCSVYVSRARTIDAGSILGEDSRAYVMPRERSVDINDELDWKFAQFLSQQLETL